MFREMREKGRGGALCLVSQILVQNQFPPQVTVTPPQRHGRGEGPQPHRPRSAF